MGRRFPLWGEETAGPGNRSGGSSLHGIVGGGGDDDGVMEPSSLHFAATVRTLASAARRRGLSVPGFRTPPKLPGADRTIRRHRGGSATVAVTVRGRPFQAVIADLIEGIVIANELDGAAATRVRTDLWEAVVDAHQQAA